MEERKEKRHVTRMVGKTFFLLFCMRCPLGQPPALLKPSEATFASPVGLTLGDCPYA